MGFYIVSDANYSKRKCENIFIFDNGIFKLINSEIILKNSAEVQDFAAKHRLFDYEIVCKSLENFEVLLESFASYLVDKDLSVGIVVLDKTVIKEKYQLIKELGITIPEHTYKECGVRMMRRSRQSMDYEVNIGSLVIKPSGPIHLEQSFHDKFVRFLIESGKENVDVYTDAGVSKQVFSKILSDKDLIPTKLTLLSLCIGLELTLRDAKELLESAGYALSKSIVLDSIITNYLKEENYDLDEINMELNEYGCPLLGWHPREK